MRCSTWNFMTHFCPLFEFRVHSRMKIKITFVSIVNDFFPDSERIVRNCDASLKGCGFLHNYAALTIFRSLPQKINLQSLQNIPVVTFTFRIVSFDIFQRCFVQISNFPLFYLSTALQPDWRRLDSRFSVFEFS